jgi:micrococcal nuclease
LSYKIWLLLLIVSVLPFCGCQPPTDNARVIEVIDGDTIVITGGHHVRYIGIDAPELYPEPEALGSEAWLANRVLVEGKTVRLERDTSDTDRYGRLLRYVYVDDVFVNAEMVRLGLARAITYPPDTRHQQYLEELEAEAIAASRGMWQNNSQRR